MVDCTFGAHPMSIYRRRDFIAALGGVVVWPVVASAQLPVVGFFSANPAAPTAHYTAAFRAGLADAGFTEGKNVLVEYRWAEGHLERLPKLALDLIRRRVAVIFTAGGDVTALVAKGATSTIPIVFTSGYDPVKVGLVASLNHPGGNVTGTTLIAGQLGAKRIELLHELVPQIADIAVVVNPNNPNSEPDSVDVKAAARALGIQVHLLEAATGPEIDAAFASLVEQKCGALLVSPDAFFLSNRDRFVRWAAREAVPAVYYTRDYADAGGLLAYGANFASMYREGGRYIGRILKGEKPADLPVVQPTKFELVINLKTAKALGITVPPTLLARADEVIE
jgi:putative ABC transport system substrate-binding protein